MTNEITQQPIEAEVTSEPEVEPISNSPVVEPEVFVEPNPAPNEIISSIPEVVNPESNIESIEPSVVKNEPVENQTLEPVVSKSIPTEDKDLVKPSLSSQEASVSQPSISPYESLGAVFVLNMKRARELLVKARLALSLRGKKRMEKIMTLFIAKTKINNKNVRDLLHVTESTATNYLNAMVKEGKIKREGKFHTSVYTKIDDK